MFRKILFCALVILSSFSSVLCQIDSLDELKIRINYIGIDLIHPNFGGEISKPELVLFEFPNSALLERNSFLSFGANFSIEKQISFLKSFYFKPEIGFAYAKGNIVVYDIVGSFLGINRLMENRYNFEFTNFHFTMSINVDFKPLESKGLAFNFGPKLYFRMFRHLEGTTQEYNVDYLQEPNFVQFIEESEYIGQLNTISPQLNLRFGINKDFFLVKNKFNLGISYEFPLLLIHQESGYKSSPIVLSIKYRL